MNSGRCSEILKLPKTRTEKVRDEFFYRTCRLANWPDKYVEITNLTGLKSRLLNLTWKSFYTDCFDVKGCTWQYLCKCGFCTEICGDLKHFFVLKHVDTFFRSKQWDQMCPAAVCCETTTTKTTTTTAATTTTTTTTTTKQQQQQQ